MKVSASVLAANHASLKQEIIKAETSGADLIHVDVMDGHFVPNIFLGIPILESICQSTQLKVDVHLMAQNPELHIDSIIASGADSITIHYESCLHIYRILEKIKQKGLDVGIAYNPTTPIDSFEYLHDIVDKVLVMTVDPGFGGQKLRKPVLNKIVKLKKMIEKFKSNALVEVDGGVTFHNLDNVAQAGADIIVIGNKIFNSPNPRTIIQNFKNPIPPNSKAVIFDFDGVIFDSEPFQHQAFNQVLRENNETPLTFEEFAPHIGTSSKQIWGKIRGSISHSPEYLTELKEKKYHQIVSSTGIHAIHGVECLLDQLKEFGWSIGLASSSPKYTLLTLLKKLKLLEYFSEITSAEEVEKGKPNPDVYDRCVEKMGLDSQYVVAIEDSENGINSAARAKLKCIAVPNQYTLKQKFNNAHLILNSITELSHQLCAELLYGVIPIKSNAKLNKMFTTSEAY